MIGLHSHNAFQYQTDGFFIAGVAQDRRSNRVMLILCQRFCFSPFVIIRGERESFLSRDWFPSYTLLSPPTGNSKSCWCFPIWMPAYKKLRGINTSASFLCVGLFGSVVESYLNINLTY